MIQMKKMTHSQVLSFFLLWSLFLSIGIRAKAAPGDTTWVQAQNDIQLDYYNNFDAAVTFPTGATSYRKIIMVFTLGKYQCPTGSQYCGDWDYTIQNYLMTPGGDTLELGRLITPYANASYPRTPFTWKQHYYFDVTEFYPLLKNNAAIRLLYSGYSGGFTANIKFAFIEGTPPRNVISIKKLWQGSYNYGNASSPIDNTITPVSVTAPTGTLNAEMKVLITGHGGDGNGCSEFCSKYYQVKQNGIMLAQQTIWKADCGYNDLYPQSGTWIYNRANWCPGQQISGSSYKLSNITAGTSYTADLDFQAYTTSGSGNPPSYTLTGLIFNYGAINNTLDASIEDILSPTAYEGDFRANPMCGSPVIALKNTGSTTLSTVTIAYGVNGQNTQTYTATGLNLAPMANTTITLPALTSLGNMSASNTAVFKATIQQVNGVADTYTINNSLQTTFLTAPDWPSSFNLTLSPNRNYTDTKWVLQDLNGNTIAQRTPTSSTSITDPIGPLTPGCYKLVVTDASCDGLYWWGNSSSTGIGAFYATDSSQTTIIPFTNGLPPVSLSGGSITVPGTSQDFGCGFTQYFRVGALLPLNLLSFYGKADNANNDLFWTTSQEQNVARYEVEYSPTGSQFTKVGQVTANGNTSNPNSYSFVHTPNPTAPVYYYRLRVVSNDGTAMYSNTIIIIPSTTKFEINSITPNPFDSQVAATVTSVANEAVTATISDIQGRLLYSKTAQLQQGINRIVMDGLYGLSAGIYTLTLVTPDGERHTGKIMHK